MGMHGQALDRIGKHWNAAIQCNGYNGMQWKAFEYNGMEWNAMECKGILRHATECNRMQRNAKECVKMQWIAMNALECIAKDCTTECNGMQWNTLESNGMQWNPTECK